MKHKFEVTFSFTEKVSKQDAFKALKKLFKLTDMNLHMYIEGKSMSCSVTGFAETGR